MTEAVAGTSFPCPQCGAPETAFDAATQQMRCPFCGYAGAVTLPAAGAPAHQETFRERSLAEGLQQQRAHAGTGFGTQTRTLKCDVCGASISFAGVQLANRCDFCGSEHVREQAANPNLIRPQALVPFGVEEAVARSKFSEWLGGLWFRPNDLKHRAEVGEIVGVYIPYWTFDAQVYSQWQADAGHYYYVTETYTTTVNGKSAKRTRQVRKTRWERAWGTRNDAYDDVLVVASQGLPVEIADELKTFDTRQLQPYDPRFLAGWRAEEYAVELDAGWVNGAQKIEQSQHQRCAGDIPGDTHRSLRVQNQFSSETFKHVLLPLWIATYRYKDEPFRFLVNGQTGEVQGRAPYSWIKIILFTLMIVAIVGGIGFALTR